MEAFYSIIVILSNCDCARFNRILNMRFEFNTLVCVFGASGLLKPFKKNKDKTCNVPM